MTLEHSHQRQLESFVRFRFGCGLSASAAPRPPRRRCRRVAPAPRTPARARRPARCARRARAERRSSRPATEPIASTISASAIAGGASCRCDPDAMSVRRRSRIRAIVRRDVRAIVRWCRCRSRVVALAVERQEHQPEHVGRRQQRRQRADHPQERVPLDERLEQDLVLAEEAGQRRDAGDRQRRRSGTSSR